MWLVTDKKDTWNQAHEFLDVAGYQISALATSTEAEAWREGGDRPVGGGLKVWQQQVPGGRYPKLDMGPSGLLGIQANA